MELKDISSSIPRVKDFLNGHKSTTPGDRLQQVLKEHSNLPKKLGGAERLTEEKLEHLTHYLLYEAEKKSPEIDILVVLPKQHRMIGEDNRVYYKTFIQLHVHDV